MSAIQMKKARSENYGSARNRSAIQYLVIHFTSNDGDTAKNNVDYFAREVTGTSAHYFVDENEIWQSVPDDYIAWHCGTNGVYYHPYCRNSNSVGIELCSRKDSTGRYYFDPQIVSRAAILAREKMAEYHIPVTNVVRHYDVTHKICPAPFVNDAEQWQAFLKQLGEQGGQEEEMTIYRTYEDVPEWGKPTVKKLVHLGYLKGDENSILDLEENALRNLVINDRAGLYDKQ